MQTVECNENENNVVLKVKENSCIKTLYIDKNTVKPIKMEIEYINQKISVYIQYNEIEFNSTKKEEIIAFNTEILKMKI